MIWYSQMVLCIHHEAGQAKVAAGLSRDVVAKSREPLDQFIPTDVAG